MEKEYTFEFLGSKELFLSRLNRFTFSRDYDGVIWYNLDHYIVKVVGDEIHFGVERAGHSGGQWFIPAITQCGNRVVFAGTVQYIGPGSDSQATQKSAFKRCMGKIGTWLGYLLLSPVVIVVYIIAKIVLFFQWVINKLRHRPTKKPKTTEEKLCELMESYLGCIRKEDD